MQFINKIKSLFKKQMPLIYRQSINGGVPIYPKWEAKANADKYCTSDDVYSVVRLISTTSAMIPLLVYKIKDKSKKRKVEALSYKANLTERELLTKAAFDEVAENDDVFLLLENPSKILNKFEFYEALYTLLLLQGEVFLWKELKEFGANKGKVESLHILYPQWVIMNVNENYPFSVISYTYMVDGLTVMEKIPADEIIHIKYFNPNFGVYNNQIRGHSPLKSLAKVLERMESGVDASVSQMQNGGVPGIVWERGVGDVDAAETLGQRKKNFYNYATKIENKGMPFFAAGDMGYIELGLKLADLQVAELGKIDFKKLCNAYGVSDILFNNGESSTESNVKEMSKRLYTNTILPNIQRVRDAINASILPHYKAIDRYVNYDLSGITELQEDMKDLSEWLGKSWWILPNEKRELQKFGALPIEMFNQPLIPSSLTTLEDIEMQNNLPINGEYSGINKDSE